MPKKPKLIKVHGRRHCDLELWLVQRVHPETTAGNSTETAFILPKKMRDLVMRELAVTLDQKYKLTS